MDARFPGARPFGSPLAPVVWIALPPAFLRLTLVGPVIRVGGHFGLLPSSFPFPLTGGTATIALIFDAGVGRHLAATA